MSLTDDVVLLYAHPSTRDLAKEIAECCDSGGSFDSGSLFGASPGTPTSVKRVVNDVAPIIQHVCFAVLCTISTNV